MAARSPQLDAWRDRIETVLRVASPGLNLVLAVGDRVSRLVERDDPAYVPPRRTPLS